MKQVTISRNTIEYQEIGKGYPIVFMHGAFSNGNTWRKLLPELSNYFRCIIPEWPFGGHKMAIQSDMDFTPLGIADFTANLLTTLSIDRIAIMANDTGGAYAQVFTAKYPHFVSHLIISNCEGFEVFPPKKFQSIKKMVKMPGYLWLLARLFSYKPSLKWNLTFGLLSHQLKKEELYELYVKTFSKNKLIREDFKKLALGWSPKYTLKASEELTHYKNPVLILWGADDIELFPMELGKRLASLFTNCTFVEISNSLTYVQEDNPQECIAHILRFARQNGLIRGSTTGHP